MANPLLLLNNINKGVTALTGIVVGAQKIIPKKKEKYILKDNLVMAILDVKNAIDRLEGYNASNPELKSLAVNDLELALGIMEKL